MNLPSVQSLPSFLESLSSLQQLYIGNVPMLRELPNLPPSLKHLMIWECHPELKERYGEDGGSHRHKIAHIPTILIDKVQILAASRHILHFAENQEATFSSSLLECFSYNFLHHCQHYYYQTFLRCLLPLETLLSVTVLFRSGSSIPRITLLEGDEDLMALPSLILLLYFSCKIAVPNDYIDVVGVWRGEEAERKGSVCGDEIFSVREWMRWSKDVYGEGDGKEEEEEEGDEEDDDKVRDDRKITDKAELIIKNHNVLDNKQFFALLSSF
ncbi:hypothetical protein MA16_Dca027403 [Dendrobium catenatum]|uniref:Uncharacterized protein n=1 Tax=Dendrobium catenatum TaxID=906689 RepID=A0A2I0VD10_9ASPA|nr:hypothetical protein MA16_Dca027403 [Dendrobium catenatum]